MSKKKIIFIISFITALILFDRSIFTLLTRIENNLYMVRGFKEKFISKGSSHYDIIIMGSSRAKRGILPIYFLENAGLRAKNVARNACSAKFNYYFYREYRKYAEKPKIVIYGVDYFIFKLKSNPRWLRYFKTDNTSSTMKKRGISRLISNKKQIDILLNNLQLDLNEKIRTKYSNIKELQRSEIDDFRGFPGSVSPDMKRPEKFKKYSFEEYPGEEGIYFRKLLEDLNRDKIMTILVYLPEYIGTYESNYKRELFFKRIMEIASCSRTVKFLNYNDPNVFPLDNKEFFKDGGWGFANSHLSKKGAKKFNRILIRDIRKIVSSGEL